MNCVLLGKHLARYINISCTQNIHTLSSSLHLTQHTQFLMIIMIRYWYVRMYAYMYTPLFIYILKHHPQTHFSGTLSVVSVWCAVRNINKRCSRRYFIYKKKYGSFKHDVITSKIILSEFNGMVGASRPSPLSSFHSKNIYTQIYKS